MTDLFHLLNADRSFTPAALQLQRVLTAGA
jgi:hypothetical protein